MRRFDYQGGADHVAVNAELSKLFGTPILMQEDLLTKFLKLMSSTITDSDLELTKLGNSLGLDLVSFQDICIPLIF